MGITSARCVTIGRCEDSSTSEVNGLLDRQIVPVSLIKNRIGIRRARSDRELFVLHSQTIVVNVVEIGSLIVEAEKLAIFWKKKRKPSCPIQQPSSPWTSPFHDNQTEYLQATSRPQRQRYVPCFATREVGRDVRGGVPRIDSQQHHQPWSPAGTVLFQCTFSHFGNLQFSSQFLLANCFERSTDVRPHACTGINSNHDTSLEHHSQSCGSVKKFNVHILFLIRKSTLQEFGGLSEKKRKVKT